MNNRLPAKSVEKRVLGIGSLMCEGLKEGRVSELKSQEEADVARAWLTQGNGSKRGCRCRTRIHSILETLVKGLVF